MKMLIWIAITTGTFMITMNLPREVMKRLPFMLASAPAGMMFFLLGLWSKNAILMFEKMPIRQSVLYGLLVSGILFLLLVNYRLPVITDIRGAVLSVWALPSCLIGLIVVLIAGKVLIAFRASKAILTSIGVRSLFLFALEHPLGHILSRFTNGYIPSPMYGAEHSYLIEPIRFFLVLLLTWLFSYPAMQILNRIRDFKKTLIKDNECHH